MRPVCLTMSAFGPYAGVQRLDFADLKGRSFFLIHGPTGAGKTTILDAICFALYGDASGSARDTKNIRSDHATSAVATEVEYDFAVGRAVYRVRRSPEQQRPKKRGEGVTLRPAEAELWEIKEQAEPKLTAAGWSEVTRKVEMLLGFKSSQFRQVVLLPQGDFRKLLTANSSERQEIMQVLFKTELYRQIEEGLKAKAAGVKKEFEELERRRLWVQSEAGIESLDELNNLLTGNRTALAAVDKQLAELGLKLKAAQQALADGMLNQAKLSEQDNALRDLAQYTDKVPLVAGKRQELKAAKQALSLADAEQILSRLAQETEELRAAAAENSRRLEFAQAGLAAAEQNRAMEAGREVEREAATREILQLEQLGLQVEALAQARQAQAAAQIAAEQAAGMKAVMQSGADEIKAAIRQKNEEYARLLEQSAQAPGYKAAVDDLSRMAAKRQELVEVRRQLALAERQLAEQDGVWQKLEQRYLASREALAALREAWSTGQAALMAAQLQAGQACPVCGALEHPRPARSAAGVPDAQVMKERQAEVEKLEQERERVRRLISRGQSDHSVVAARLKVLEEELGAEAFALPAEFQHRLQALQEAYAQAAAAGKQVDPAVRELQRLTENEQLLAVQREQAEQAWRQAERVRQSAEAVLQERLAAIPIQFQHSTALLQAQTEARERLRQLKQNWENAQQAAREALRQLTKIQADSENGQKNLKDRETRMLAAQQEFSSRLQAAGFQSSAEYQQAKKSPEYIKRLEERIRLFDNSLIAAEERVQRAKAAADGLTRPNLAVLEQALNELQLAQNELVAGQARLAALTFRQEKWLDTLRKLGGQTEEAVGRFGVLGRLAEVANGGNEYKLTFQRFVLGALLDDVAIAANERLRMMSRGRYQLQRTMDRARKNAAGGLELEVFDHYTGYARGVGTLSGGETFLASLSLALGLADVVQSYAGGIHLDTILVDEGFGTLDPEALDFALKALLDLQKGGRLVGIISHVPELKERIDARLEVFTTRQGSSACFSVG